MSIDCWRANGWRWRLAAGGTCLQRKQNPRGKSATQMEIGGMMAAGERGFLWMAAQL